MGAQLHFMRPGWSKNMQNMRLKDGLVCLEWNSQTRLLPVAFSDGGFIPLLDFSCVKASFFTWAALNYERVGGWEFLITKPYQSRLENTADIHRGLLRRWVEPEAPMSRLPSCESFAHHAEDKSTYHAGELCIFQSDSGRLLFISLKYV